MKLWIDADACPQPIREIVYRAATRLDLPMCLVANRTLAIPRSPLVTMVRVPKGADAADHYIAERVGPTDIVITADIPLAAILARKGTIAIDPRGEVYSEENVGERLSVRDFMDRLRGTGLVSGGPAQLNAADGRRFADSLDRTLTKCLKQERGDT